MCSRSVGKGSVSHDLLCVHQMTDWPSTSTRWLGMAFTKQLSFQGLIKQLAKKFDPITEITGKSIYHTIQKTCFSRPISNLSQILYTSCALYRSLQQHIWEIFYILQLEEWNIWVNVVIVLCGTRNRGSIKLYQNFRTISEFSLLWPFPINSYYIECNNKKIINIIWVDF
jgi:hypothetical protein